MNLNSFCDIHKLFLQTCCNRIVLQIGQAISILSDICKKYEYAETASENDLDEVVDEINRKIQKYDFKLCKIIYQQLNMEFLIYSNSSTSSIQKLQDVYTINEIQFFQLLLKSIAIDPNHSISSINALNLTFEQENHRLSKLNTQDIIDKFLENGYLAEIDNNFYLGPLAECEFSNYLKIHYPDNFVNCQLCQSIILKGEQCINDRCNQLFHKHCLTKYLKRVSKCPKCKQNWQQVN